MKKDINSTGRLKKPLNARAHAIVFPIKEKIFLLKEFEIISLLNEAHLVCLLKLKLLPLNSVKKILRLISELRGMNFSPLFREVDVRGSYLLFENYLIKKLGIDVSGSLHIGRSRNDMNATAFKLNLRNHYRKIFGDLCTLRSTLLNKASQYIDVAMPVYSQFQVAQVGTYGYYLLAFEEALARDQHYIMGLFFSMDECPMGAASGCGTSFPIDYPFIASLLGFSRSANNALDAVADRDLALRVLSALSIVGTHISRTMQDYQLWTTQEFSFFSLPDDVCGSSSAMPQKKNPYLFEIVKGKSASINGSLVQSLTAMHNVPFGNSVEVGIEALRGLDFVLKDMSDILALTDLLISKALPIPEAMLHSINKGVAMATGVAEALVKEKSVTFRHAHYDIGSKIHEAVNLGIPPINAIYSLLDISPMKYKEIQWANANEYGGGTGKRSMQMAHHSATKKLQEDCKWMKSVEKKWFSAEKHLRSKIQKIISP